jgi:LuxR family maltose regulon positive regulatory protein
MALGAAALERGDWVRARELFEAALAEGESAEALEGLGRACWWLDDVQRLSEVRERAYRLYRERGDVRSAARLACQLANDAMLFRGEEAVFNGWSQRARRLLAGAEECPEHAILTVHEAFFAFMLLGDPTTTRRWAVAGAELANRFGLIDQEMLALALEGIALVAEGQIREGMGRLDEAVAAATAGEMRQIELIGLTCCFMIDACERVRDFERAGQWCTRMREYCSRMGLPSLLAVCRTHYGTVLTERGEWTDAEAELLMASEQLARRPAQAVEALARLGELRRRQGRYEEAAALLEKVPFHPKAQIALSALALDGGELELAVEWAERFLRQVKETDRTQRAHGFELLARAQAALGNIDRARAALAELQRIAQQVQTPPLDAAAVFARGVIEAAAGALDLARAALEDATDRYERTGMPFEAAETRMALAGVLAQAGRSEIAEREARRAAETFGRLGAAHAARRTLAPGAAALSERELEVLRLVAQGLSDREIAERLVVSPHTVHRHVSNILIKLGLPSRAAAAAQATKAGLL